MPRQHRSHSMEFKRQVVQECLGGETLHGLAKRHDISRQLIRIWLEKYEAGAFDDDAQAVEPAPNEGLWCSRFERRPDVRLYRRGISAGTRDLAQLDTIDDRKDSRTKMQFPVDQSLIM